jgi:hypothetical protein
MAGGFHVKATEWVQAGLRVHDGKIRIQVGPRAEEIAGLLRADADGRTNGYRAERTTEGVIGALAILGAAFAAGVGAGWVLGRRRRRWG